MPIDKAQQGPCCSSDMIAGPSRTQRDQFGGKDKPQPLQPISDSLPGRPHCGVSTTKSECLTPRFAYQPCPGLLTGGKVFRNSFCWRSASLCSSDSRACCSGLGPLEQPRNPIRSIESKIDLISSFFIGKKRTIIRGINAATFRQVFHGPAKADYSTLVTSYSSTAWSRYFCSSDFKCSRISFNASSFFKLT